MLTFSLMLTTKLHSYVPKEGNISAILGPFVFKSDFTESNSGAKAPQNVGTSLIAIGDISNHGSLEVAFFYMNKVFMFHDDSNFLTLKTQLIHVTMGYRYWWTSYLSSSLAIFSAYPTGEISVIHSDFTGNSLPTTAAHAKAIYGVESAIQGELWSHGRYAVTSELRYSKALTTESANRANHYGLILSLRYFIQEKNKVEGPPP